MKSMTGYGYKEQQDEAYQYSLEIKAYNNRYLDLFVNVPSFISPLEPKIREYLSKRIRRGRVEVNIRMREVEEQGQIYLDKKAASSYVKLLNELKNETGLEDEVRLGHLLRMEGLFRVEKDKDLDKIWTALEPLLQDVFDAFQAERVREGAATKDDILESLALLQKGREYIAGFQTDLEEGIKKTIKDRFAEVLDGKIDEDRVLAETAVLLVKYSINEELVRLKSHLENFRSICSENDSVGKKLDFLCQELNREINTIGSKSTVYEVNQKVIHMKDALENIREQLRNIE